MHRGLLFCMPFACSVSFEPDQGRSRCGSHAAHLHRRPGTRCTNMRPTSTSTSSTTSRMAGISRSGDRFSPYNVNVIRGSIQNLHDNPEQLVFVADDLHVDQLEVVVGTLGKCGDIIFWNGEQHTPHRVCCRPVSRTAQAYDVPAPIWAGAHHRLPIAIDVKLGTGTEPLRKVGLGLDLDVASESPRARDVPDDYMPVRRI